MCELVLAPLPAVRPNVGAATIHVVDLFISHVSEEVEAQLVGCVTLVEFMDHASVLLEHFEASSLVTEFVSHIVMLAPALV